MNPLVRLTAGLALALAAGCASPHHTASCPTKPDLTGTWLDPHGARHSVRQIGQNVWWVARSGDGGRTFTSVFHGRLHGHTLTGQFADVPEGNNHHSGKLKAKLVVSDGRVTAIQGEIQFPGGQSPVAWVITPP